MSYENVKLWFAKNEEGNIITIDDIDELNKKNTHYCPVCGSDLTPKATKSKRITPHFAHVDASKCNSESQIHFWFKHKFLEKGDKFNAVSDKERNYVCKEVLVEQSYETEIGTYRPDATILTECGKIIYFEMAFSNKKKVRDYLDIWLDLKNIVVEVDIKQLKFKDKIPTFKALFYDGKCFNTKKNDTYYNTIGRYKEEKSRSKIDNELKERIRKLDW
ncbi:competence protein CoiA family protein, partial [Cytobacillus praedii]